MPQLHDANKVLLGSTRSNIKDVRNFPSDPATFKAGLAVRGASDGGLILAAATGRSLVGVSLGQSLSAKDATDVVGSGNEVPICLKTVQASLKVGDITFTAKSPYWGTLGHQITVALLDEQDDGSAEVVYDEEEPLAIVVNIESTVTLAQAIKDAIDEHEQLSELVTVTIDEGDEDVAQSAAAEAPLANGSDVAVVGAAVKIDGTSGEASADGTTSGAVYLTGMITGVYPDGTEVPAAIIAMPGGL